MKIRSNAKIIMGEPSEVVTTLISDRSLGAKYISIEWTDKKILPEGLGSGNAMLYRENTQSGETFVAMETYTDAESDAMLKRFIHSYQDAEASVEWLNNEANWFHKTYLVWIAIIAGIVIYGTYVQFFGSR